MQINKSDRNDAVGIARIMQCGWYKEVRVKDLGSAWVIRAVSAFQDHVRSEREIAKRA